MVRGAPLGGHAARPRSRRGMGLWMWSLGVIISAVPRLLALLLLLIPLSGCPGGVTDDDDATADDDDATADDDDATADDDDSAGDDDDSAGDDDDSAEVLTGAVVGSTGTATSASFSLSGSVGPAPGTSTSSSFTLTGGP